MSWWHVMRLVGRAGLMLSDIYAEWRARHPDVPTIRGKRVVIRDRTGEILAEPRPDHVDPGPAPHT